MKLKRYIAIGIFVIMVLGLYIGINHRYNVDYKKTIILSFMADSGLYLEPARAEDDKLVPQALQLIMENQDNVTDPNAAVWRENSDIVQQSIMQLGSNQYPLMGLLSSKKEGKERMDQLNNLFLLSFLTTHISLAQSRNDTDWGNLLAQGKALYNIGIKLNKEESYIIKVAGYACKSHGVILLKEYCKRTRNNELDEVLRCLEWDLNESKNQLDYELKWPLLSHSIQSGAEKK